MSRLENQFTSFTPNGSHKIVVHNQWEREVKKLDHRQMDAKMALVSVTHAFVQSVRRIPGHASLKRGENGIEILRGTLWCRSRSNPSG